jgi:Uma2 family endonuclease
MQELTIPAAEILTMLHAPPSPLPINGGTWPVQSKWTFDDLARLPDDGNRYELIAGVLYMSPSPRYNHQYIVSTLLRILGSYIAAHKLGVVLPAPFEIRLPFAVHAVQPDVLFIRNDNQPPPNAPFFAGIPDLVVEVISPSSLRLDRVLKFATYEDAGVPELWLVDPVARSVEVYVHDEQFFTLHGQFSMGDVLTSPLLPEFNLEVATLFAW